MPHPAAIGQEVQCDLQRFNRRFNPCTLPSRCTHALLPAYTQPLEDSEIGTFPPTGLSLVMELPGSYPRTSEAFLIVAMKRADHVVLPLQVGKQGAVSLPKFYAVLAAVEADVVETIVPYSIVRR
jgi:hypothetical protein